VTSRVSWSTVNARTPNIRCSKFGSTEIRVHETLLTLVEPSQDAATTRPPPAIGADGPHHVTRRGRRRRPVVFGDDDCRLPVALMVEPCRASGVAVRAWCLMPDHGRSILVPPSGEALAGAMADTHRRNGVRPGGHLPPSHRRSTTRRPTRSPPRPDLAAQEPAPAHPGRAHRLPASHAFCHRVLNKRLTRRLPPPQKTGGAGGEASLPALCRHLVGRGASWARRVTAVSRSWSRVLLWRPLASRL
jgi:hypothetical protein